MRNGERERVSERSQENNTVFEKEKVELLEAEHGGKWLNPQGN